MRRIISAILCLACLCMLPALSVAAAPTDPLAVQFQAFINDCDSLYAGDVKEYALSQAKAAYVYAENPGPVDVPAAEFEAEIEKYIVLSEELRNNIRNSLSVWFDFETDTYTLQYSAATTDTQAEKRQYKGYVKTEENTCAVYYQSFEWEALNASAEVISQNKNPITGNVEYNGKVYTLAPDGKYYCVKNWGNGGIKYSIEMMDGKMRFISGESYGADAQPETFDDAVVTYDLPGDNAVYLSDIAYFPNNTTVKVERITQADALEKVDQAMANISTRYVPYEFTAIQGDTPVQPLGRQEVCFAIPADFGVNVAVMHLTDDGELTDVPSNEKNIEGTPFLFVKLEHFSTYILVDEDAAPAPTTGATTAPTTEPATAPTTEPATAPTTEPATAPTTEPATAPTTEPATAPTTEPATAPTAEATTAPTTAATRETAAATKETAEATKATTAETKATTGETLATSPATKVTAAATKPVGSTPLKPTVPATGETVADPTEETGGDPTAEATVAPTEEVVEPTDETGTDSTEETTADPTDTPKKSNKTGIILTIVIVIVLVLAAGVTAIWWFYFRKKGRFLK